MSVGLLDAPPIPKSPESEMTILAALAENDGSIVLAADSYEQCENSLLGFWEWVAVDKFMHVRRDGVSLEWGYAGSGIGDEFGQWLDDYQVTTWDQFRKDAAVENRRLNEQAYPDAETMVNTIVAGYINGEFGMIGLDPLGAFHNGAGRALMVGAGAEALGLPAWREAIADGKHETPELLKSVLDSIINRVSGLKGPLRMWRLTDHDFTELTDQ